jgi:D-amino-acid dehydrogenase
MKRSADVLIIGGGVIGVCTAHFLLEQGRSITLLDKDDICAGSSYGNGGLVVPSHAVPLAAPGVTGQALRWLLDPTSPFYIQPRFDPELLDWLWRFARASHPAAVRRAIPVLLGLNRASLELFRALARRAELAFGFEQRGGLYVFTSQSGLHKGILEAERLRQYGCEVAILDGAGVHQLVPAVRPAVVGGVYYREDAHLIPDRFVHALADLVQRQGGEVCAGTEVIACETSGGRVTRVVTTRGDFLPQQVVLAAGAWSPRLGQSLDLLLPVQPAKGYSITLPRPAAGVEIPLHLAERKVGVTPMGAMLRFAGTLELAGLDLSINRRRVDAILQAAKEYLDFDPDPQEIRIWRGLRPLTPDTLPIIGRSRQLENLVVATGHGMLGVSMGPITGKLVAQLITGQAPELDLSPLAVERFA